MSAAGAAPGAAAGGASASGLPDSPPNISWLNGRKVVVFKKSDIKDLKPGEEWVMKAAAIFNQIVANPEYNDVQFAFEQDLTAEDLKDADKVRRYTELTQRILQALPNQDRAFVVIKTNRVAKAALDAQVTALTGKPSSGITDVTEDWAAVRAMKDSPIADYHDSEYEKYVKTFSAGAAAGTPPGSPASPGAAAVPAGGPAAPVPVSVPVPVPVVAAPASVPVPVVAAAGGPPAGLPPVPASSASSTASSSGGVAGAVSSALPSRNHSSLLEGLIDKEAAAFPDAAAVASPRRELNGAKVAGQAGAPDAGSGEPQARVFAVSRAPLLPPSQPPGATREAVLAVRLGDEAAAAAQPAADEGPAVREPSEDSPRRREAVLASSVREEPDSPPPQQQVAERTVESGNLSRTVPPFLGGAFSAVPDILHEWREKVEVERRKGDKGVGLAQSEPRRADSDSSGLAATSLPPPAEDEAAGRMSAAPAESSTAQPIAGGNR